MRSPSVRGHGRVALLALAAATWYIWGWLTSMIVLAVLSAGILIRSQMSCISTL